MEAGARQAPGRATIGTAAAEIAAGSSRAGSCQFTEALRPLLALWWAVDLLKTNFDGLTVNDTPCSCHKDRNRVHSKSCSPELHCPPQVEAACMMLQSELRVMLQRQVVCRLLPPGDDKAPTDSQRTSPHPDGCACKL